MLLTFNLDSNISSGVGIFLFNIAFLSLCHLACHSISASYNIHQVHDRKKPLSPRRSNFGFLFGGPIGHISVVRTLTIVIIIYEVFAFLFDFSINGSSKTRITPTKHASLVRTHPEGVPLQIDYLNEFNETLPQDEEVTSVNFISERLVAVTEVQACKYLNFTHHINLAYAFKDIELSKTVLAPKNSIIAGGECVQSGKFENDMVLQAFDQSPPSFDCSYDNISISQERRNCSVDSRGRGICDTSLEGVDEESCELSFHDTRCFRRNSEIERCASVAEFKSYGATNIVFAVFKNPTNEGEWPETYNLRGIPNLSREHYAAFAGNIAFFSAIDSRYGSFNSMFMAMADVTYNTSLNVVDRVNITEVNLYYAIPAVSVMVIILATVYILAAVWRQRYVVGRGRQEYLSFSNVNEMFDFDNEGHLHKSRAKHSNIYITLQHNRPMLVTNTSDMTV